MSTQDPADSRAEDAHRKRRKAYKKSLNLPRTGFAMRANLSQHEPASLRRWNAAGLYRRIVDAGREAPSFTLHDGPPYANGAIHIGHLMNRVLKDLVVRSRNLMGERCAFVPGWDCHGLPIEHKVLSELIESGKAAKLEALDEDRRRMAIRRACAAYAAKFKKLQAAQMQRLLTLADYDHPYLTMTQDYEQAVLEVFALLIEQGIVYRDLKPVHWSIANRTALAEAELEYRQREDPSVYVRFAASDPAALARAFGLDPRALEQLAGSEAVGPSLAIWTTTPWTLPANMLIAVHPGYRYALVRLGAHAPTVIACSRVEPVRTAIGLPATILAEASGEALIGLGYDHPLCDRWPLEELGAPHHGRVVGAEYVTLEDGTGLVHTATGHGQEDYQTGQREGVAVYCPVRADGTYDDSVPDWLRGLSVFEANPLIVERLRDSGHLLHHAPYSHSYPHDWRSKTPVIFRCTEQWFIAVDRPTRRDQRSLRALALAAVAQDVRFVPAWGQNRMRGMVESRPDWCISRQRAWGLPIPAFELPDGQILLSAASVRAVAAVFGREGSDAWFTHTPADLLAGWDPAADPDAPEGADPATLKKMYDIIDVWFESGASYHAVMRARGLGFPVDLYLEGSDQHRGWFQSTLLLGLGATGQAPMKTILTHGFMVDKDRRKMSKSEGNALEVEALVAEFGADVCRWWVSSLVYENDIKVDHGSFVTASDSYRKVRNTLRYLLSNLSDFDPGKDAVDPASIAPTSIDAFALEAASRLRVQVVDAFTRLVPRQAHLALFDFCNDTLSAFYLDALKDRLYCDRPNSARRRRTQSALRSISELLITLLAPLLPHTADEAWRALTGDTDGSVHLGRIPPLAVRADPRWPQVLACREQVLRRLEAAKDEGIENPLDALVRIADPSHTLADFRDDLADIFGVSRVELRPGDATTGRDGSPEENPGIEVIDLREQPRCERSWRRDATVKQRSDGGWLSDRDAEAAGVA